MVRDEYRNTKVYYRLLPVFDTVWDTVKILEDRKSVYVRTREAPIVAKNFIPTYWKFESDGIFYNNSQEEVFRAVTANGVLERFFEGYNGIILCYGQTYSGKTVTTGGLNNSYEDRGLIPRVIEQLFVIKEIEKQKGKVTMQLKYVETNRNYVRDLLTDSEELYDINTVDSVPIINIKDADELMQIIFQAETRKTFKYRDSYLSNIANSVLTFILSCKSYSTSYTSIGKLHIVDLCGADTEGHQTCMHKNGLEVGIGNLAKSQLEQFLLVLNENNTLIALNKQRLSIIIYYLREALNNKSILRFIGHFRASNDDSRVALSMLRFGQLVKGLMPQKLKANISSDQDTELKMLREELCLLKKERDLNAMLNNEDLVGNMSQERYEFIQKLVDDYLHDKSGEIVILNTADAVLAMKVFKNVYNKIEIERNALFDLTKLADETHSSTKQRESVSSRASKKNSTRYSNNSIVSLNKSKKSSTKKVARSARESRRDTASLAEYPDSSHKSTKTSRMARKKSGKRKSVESSVGLKSEASMAASVHSRVPESIPTHTEAWDAFTVDPDCKYGEIKEELEVIEQNMFDIYNIYSVEIEYLREVTSLAQTRQDELLKAKLLKDFEQKLESDGSVIPTEMEIKCTHNLQIAETGLLEQKEKVLKIQAELKLVLDCKHKIKGDIDKRYEEFCKTKYMITVPDINSESNANATMTNSKSCEISAINLETPQPQLPDKCQDFNKNVFQYNELRKYMNKEYSRRMRENMKNKKWVRYCT